MNRPWERRWAKRGGASGPGRGLAGAAVAGASGIGRRLRPPDGPPGLRRAQFSRRAGPGGGSCRPGWRRRSSPSPVPGRWDIGPGACAPFAPRRRARQQREPRSGSRWPSGGVRAGDAPAVCGSGSWSACAMRAPPLAVLLKGSRAADPAKVLRGARVFSRRPRQPEERSLNASLSDPRDPLRTLAFAKPNRNRARFAQLETAGRPETGIGPNGSFRGSGVSAKRL